MITMELPWWLRWKRIYLECRRPGFDPWAGRIPWRRERLPTPVFLPGNSMDRGAWWATVHGVPKSPTQLSNLTFTFFHKTYCKSLQNTWEYYNILYLFYYKPFQWFLGMYKLDWNSNSKTFFPVPPPPKKITSDCLIFSVFPQMSYP